MVKNMKGTLTFLFTLCTLVAGAHERNFMEGYTIEPSQSNDGATVSGLSLLDENLAVNKEGTIYEASLNDSLDIQSLSEKKDLSALEIEGQFAQKGNKLYFCKKDGVLYCSTRKNGKWGEAQKVEMDGMGSQRIIDEGSSFAYRRWTYRPKTVRVYSPALSQNGKRLYFVSDKDGGKGAMDIWYSDVKPNGNSWSAPKNLETVNSDGNELNPTVVGDSVLYFASDKKDALGGVNLYKVSLKKTPSAVTMVARDFNSVKDDEKFIVAEKVPFVISNRGGKSEIYRPNVIMEEPVDTTPVDTTPVIAVVRKDFRTCVLYFVYDETNMVETYDAEFQYLFNFINEDAETQVMVVGHTDERGEDSYNMTLSQDRAKAVYQRLVKMGVPSARMSYKGEGERSPVIPNAKTEEEHQKNRRVEVIKIDSTTNDKK